MTNLVRLGCAIVAALSLNIAYAGWQPVMAQGSTTIVISEFRTRGPGTAGTGTGNDEFVELTNISATSIDISGYLLRASNNAGTVGTRATVPASTPPLPPGGHYLFTNSTAGGYSLAAYPGGTGDTTYATGVTDTGGAAITLPDNTVIDQVGLSAGSAFKEGTPLTSLATNTAEQYSYVRKLTNGVPQDTNDNTADFVLVSNTGMASGVTAILGAPGPESTQSPIQRNAQIKATLIDPAAGTGSPNRTRDTTPYLDALTPSSPTGVTTGVPNSTYSGGTLSIQRRFTNNTGQTITRLRFRVVDITTLNSPGYTAGGAQADVRFLTSNGTLRAPVGVTLLGITIDQPPTQQFGAALNSSGTVTLTGGTLAQGASVDVQFLLGVVQGGTFRYLVNVEALPAPAGVAAPPPASTKGTRSAKQ